MNEQIIGEIRDGVCWCGKRVLERREMPGRRGGDNFEFTHQGLRYHASIRYSTDTAVVPSEIFLNCSKVDSSADLAARDAAILASVALQYGVPLADLAHALGRDPDGLASSPIGKLLDILLGKDK
jgi:ribonucleoside-diphosphate reductase alpha chain